MCILFARSKFRQKTNRNKRCLLIPLFVLRSRNTKQTLSDDKNAVVSSRRNEREKERRRERERRDRECVCLKCFFCGVFFAFFFCLVLLSIRERGWH